MSDQAANILGRTIRETICDAFYDEHSEKNIVVALLEIAGAIHRLGNADADTQMGGLEALGKQLGDSAQTLAGSASEIAEAIREFQAHM